MTSILDKIDNEIFNIEKYRRKPHAIVFNLTGFKKFSLLMVGENKLSKDFRYRGILIVVCSSNKEIQVVCNPIEFLMLSDK
jgi:hypothetical protein